MDYGTVEYKGLEISLKQQPFCDTQHRNNYLSRIVYQAYGEDSAGNDYLITWPITNADAEDESDCCDWEDYEVKAI